VQIISSGVGFSVKSLNAIGTELTLRLLIPERSKKIKTPKPTTLGLAVKVQEQIGWD